MLIPENLIVTYKSNENRNGPVYMEFGSFVKKGKDYYPSGMTPLGLKDLKKIVSITKTSKGIYLDGLLPKNVIYYSNDGLSSVVIWLCPQANRKMLFFNKELTGEYHIPNVMFVAKDQDLSVYLVKKRDVADIKLETLLYQTHFMNVYESCKVCIGSGYKPNLDSTPLSEFIKKAEFNFFEGSSFNMSHVGDWVLDVWKNNKGSFPEKSWDKKKAIQIRSLLSKL